MTHYMVSRLAALSLRLSQFGLPLAYENVVVEPSGDAFEDAVKFYRAVGWAAAQDLLAVFGA